MIRALNGVGFQPTQYKLEGHRPDLTKMDTFLGTMSTSSDSFELRLKDIMERIEHNGLKETFKEYCCKNSVID